VILVLVVAALAWQIGLADANAVSKFLLSHVKPAQLRTSFARGLAGDRR
jgi:hypothetical protein